MKKLRLHLIEELFPVYDGDDRGLHSLGCTDEGELVLVYNDFASDSVVTSLYNGDPRFLELRFIEWVD